MILSADGTRIIDVIHGDIRQGRFDIPYKVTSIDAWAFAMCGSLKELRIPQGFTIGDWAFIRYLIEYLKGNKEVRFSKQHIEQLMVGFTGEVLSKFNVSLESLPKEDAQEPSLAPWGQSCG